MVGGIQKSIGEALSVEQLDKLKNQLTDINNI